MATDPDAPLTELRAFLAEAWRARSPAELRAYGGVAKALTGEMSADYPAPPPPAPDEPAPRGWEPAVEAELALSPPSQAFELEGWERHALASEDELARSPTRSGPAEPEAAAPEVPEEIVAAALPRIERVMALSGAVVSTDLIAALAPGVGRAVLDALAARCDRRLTGTADNRWEWTLNAARRDVLLREVDRPALAVALADARAVPTDEAGRLLRRYVGGARPAAAELAAAPLAELRPAVQALAWAAPLDPAFAALLAAARRAETIAGLRAGYDQLLADGFFGREGPIAQLHGFVAALPATPDIGGRAVPVLGVSGIGGAGKSTLLAQALRTMLDEAVDDRSKPIAISIDFDRRRFLDGGELEWSFELTRQIGLFVPELAAPLAAARQNAREQRRFSGEETKDGSSGLESMLRDSHGFEYDAAPLIATAGLAARKLVIVLDTFEEWQRGAWQSRDRDAPAWRVLEWISTLSDSLKVTPGVVVSGRAPVQAPGFVAAPNQIVLRDLHQAPARMLLARLGVDAGSAAKLAALVGGNPLSLKLAARYFLKLPEERRAAFVEGEAESLAGLDAALRQGLLYRRFLDHIPEGDVRRLAHPGLALRRVTAELIRDVLAGPCELGPISPGDARALVDKLEREAWLVERDGDALVHRADVRRAMLHQMATDPEQAPRLRAVHEAAIAWFDARPDPESRIEAAFHRLSLSGADALDQGTVPLETLRRLVPALGDFEDATRARIRDTLGLRLSTAEARLLPAERRRDWAERRARDLAERGQPRGAIRFWRQAGLGSSIAPWYVQAAFQAPDWDAEIPLLGVPQDAELRVGRLAYAFLLAFSRPDAAQRQQELDAVALIMEGQQSSRFVAMPAHEILLENAWFRRIATGDAPQRGSSDWLERLAGNAKLTVRGMNATEVRRIAAMTPDNAMLDRYDLRQLLAQSFRPMPSWLHGLIERLRALGAAGDGLSRFEDRLAHFADGAEALLGDVARDFADVVAASFPSPPPLLRRPDILGCRGDDPEWRVPIRETLAAALREPAEFARFAEQVGELFELTPRDLRPDALIALHRGAPRGMWLKLVEFADRCGALEGLLAAAAPERHPAVAVVVKAYGRWAKACASLAQGARPQRSAGA